MVVGANGDTITTGAGSDSIDLGATHSAAESCGGKLGRILVTTLLVREWENVTRIWLSMVSATLFGISPLQAADQSVSQIIPKGVY